MFLVVLLQLLILGGVGFAGCWVSQRAGFPRVVGGVLAGLLLGPMVLGNIAPGPFHYIFIGDYEAYREVTDLERERGEARQTLEATGVTGVALEEFDAQTRRLLGEAEGERAESDQSGRRVTQILLIPAGLAVIVAAGLATPMRSRRAFMPALLMAVASSGGGAAAGALAGWIMVAAGWYEPPESRETAWWIAALATACAAAAAPVSRALIDRMNPSAPQSHAPRAATLAALLAFAAAAVLTGLATSRGDSAWLSTDPALIAFYAAVTAFIILAIALLAAATSPPPPPSTLERPHRSDTLAGGLLNLGQPLLFAIAGLQLNLTGVHWILLLLVALAAGEGKGLPALIVERTTRHLPWLEAMPAAAMMSCGGALPILLAMVLLHGGLIDGPLYAALVLASLLYALLAVAIIHTSAPAAGPDTQT